MKILAIYDDGGKTFDRYTVYFNQIEKENPKEYLCLAMSERPFSPQGFCQHSSGQLGRHNGKKIELKDLPLDCQRAICKDIFPIKVRPLKKLKRDVSIWSPDFSNHIYAVERYDFFTVNDAPVNDMLFVCITGPNDYDYELIYPDECEIIE